MSLRYFIYARKSSESEDRQVLSIESQINEMQALAEKLKLAIVDVLLEAKSAKAPGRPIYNEMMKRLAKKEADGILCWKLDRLTRNPIDGGSLSWALRTGTIKEIVTPGRTYNESSADSFWVSFEFSMAAKYIHELSENVRRGLKAKAEKGEPPAAILPLGYLRDPKRGDAMGDAERFDTVQRLWREVLHGVYRPREVLDMANEIWGLRTLPHGKHGGGKLSRNAFYHLLHNPFYMGFFRYNGKLYQGNYQPMVTPAEWKQVQQLLGRSDNPKPKGGQLKEFTYRGLFFCGHCQSRLTVEEHTNPYGSHYVYYRCRKKRPFYDHCPQPWVDERLIEAQATAFLEKLTLPDRLVQWANSYIAKVGEVEKGKDDSSKRAVKNTLAGVEREIQNLTRAYTRELINEKEFLAERNRLTVERSECEKALSAKDDPSGRFELFGKLVSFSTIAKKRFVEGTPADKRQVLLTIGSNFILNDRILQIEAKKPFQLILERSRFPTMRAWLNEVRTYLSSEATFEELSLPPGKV